MHLGVQDFGALLRQLSNAKEQLEAFTGLGTAGVSAKFLMSLEQRVLKSGRLVNFIGGTPLAWYRSRSELTEVLIERLELVGIRIRDPLHNANDVISHATRIAPVREIELVRGQSIPSGPRVFLVDRDVEMRFLNSGPRIVRYRMIDKTYEETLQARESLISTLKTQANRCLQTGRIVAFRATAHGSEMVLPSYWEKSHRIHKNDRFLLTCEVSSLVAEQRSGPIPRDVIARIRKAKEALQQLYAHPDLKDRKIKKADAAAVFVEFFSISGNSFETNVWSDSNIPNWKKRGRVVEADKANPFEIRDLLNQLI